MIWTFLLPLCFTLLQAPQRAAPAEGDLILKNFRFTSGETLPELRMHYRILYALEASRDYDPGPGLEKIAAPLVAINTADDTINPPELQILEKEIARVKKGRAIVLPLSERTVGHGTHTQAAVWKQYLEELLRATAK